MDACLVDDLSMTIARSPPLESSDRPDRELPPARASAAPVHIRA